MSLSHSAFGTALFPHVFAFAGKVCVLAGAAGEKLVAAYSALATLVAGIPLDDVDCSEM